MRLEDASSEEIQTLQETYRDPALGSQYRQILQEFVGSGKPAMRLAIGERRMDTVYIVMRRHIRALDLTEKVYLTKVSGQLFLVDMEQAQEYQEQDQA